MREITTHRAAGQELDVTIEADELGPGNAPHSYLTSWTEDAGGRETPVIHAVAFQRGPIKEVGINGVSHEALLAIVADRLEHFQAGPYQCWENAQALHHIKAALHALHERTSARIARGVEGTSTK
jgi:hypothetical protein